MANNTGFSDCWTYPKEVIDEKLEVSTQQYESYLEGIQAAGDDAIAAVEEAGEDVLESIPEDYTQLSEDVSSLKADFNQLKEATVYAIHGANYWNPDDAIDGYLVGSSGNLVENSNIIVSDYLEIPTGYTYVLGCAKYNAENPSSWSFSYGRMGFYNEDKTFIERYSSTVAAVAIPNNAKYVRVDFVKTYGDKYVGFSNDTSLPTYEPYSVSLENIALLKANEIDGRVDNLMNVKLKTPSAYDLVVGDTFQLFYKGIVNSVYDENYYVLAQCSQGNNYKRLFEITPVTAGNITLALSLYDGAENKLDEKTITLSVHAKASSPATQKNILCVGDSLTTSGEWVKELKRRLTTEGGSPVGDNLSNINFIGTRMANGVNFEGYGGWTFNSYNTENVSNNSKVITCSHDKTDDDQHSIYSASNGSTWKLETIENGTIKILLVSGVASTFPATGVLTWVSGGINHSDIVYTASVNSAGNPFWNSVTNEVDFATYAENLGVNSIDYVYVLIGWNSVNQSESSYKSDAQTFINNVHASFPNARITLVGLEIPSRDGLGVNYGATGVYSKYYKLMQFVHNLDNWYADLASNNNKVYSINLSGQFDTQYNMITGTRYVNTRNSTEETYQTNGVHPATSGYLQIADAVYRHITYLISLS